MRDLYYSGAVKDMKKLNFCKLLPTLGVVLATSIFTIAMNDVAEADTAKIKSKEFTATAINGHRTVRVISRGHERFDAIEDGGTLRVNVAGHVDTKGIARVLVGGFLLGHCTASPNCSQFTMRFIESQLPDAKRWNFNKTLFIPTDLITHDSSSGIAPYPDGNRLIEGCNSRMNGDGPVRNVKYITNMNISASARTKRWKPFDGFFAVGHWNEFHFGGDVGISDNFLVDVECVPSEQLLSEPASVTTRVEDLDSENPGSCPRSIKHFTSIYYYQPTDVRFNIKLNGEVVQSVEQSTIAQALSDGTTQHVLHHETEIVSPGGPNGYQIKIVGGGESTVKYYQVYCAGLRVTSSHLKYNFVPTGECPRTVWETATFYTNGPGLVNYKIKHSGGLVFKQGEVEAQLFGTQYKAVAQRTFAPIDSVDWDLNAIPEGFETAESGWTKLKLQCSHESDGEFTLDTNPQDDAINPVVASWEGDIFIADGNTPKGEYKRPAQVSFQVEREKSGDFDYHISCSNGRSFSGSAQSFNSGGAKWKAFGTHDFNMLRPMNLQCRLREVKSSGKTVSIDMVSLVFGGSVNPDLGEAPGGLTVGGKNTNSATSGKKVIGTKNPTPEPKKPVRVNQPKPKKAKEPVRTNPKPKAKPKSKKAKLTCLGGKVKGSKCVCGKNKLKRKISSNKYQCIAVAKPPKKKPVLRTNPKTKKDKAVRTNSSKKKKKVALVCKGGKVRSNKCKCPKGFSRKKTGNKKFLCFRPAG